MVAANKSKQPRRKTKSRYNPALFISAFVLLVLLSFNIYQFASTPKEILEAKILSSSISKGDSYYGKLQLWKIYLTHGDLIKAAKYEKYLDPQDTHSLRQLYSPTAIKEQINQLQLKTNKTAEDWILLSQLYYRLGDKKLAKDAIVQAQSLDPVRDDLDSLLRSIN